MAYLDHNATTPLAAGVLEEMLPHLRGNHGNPSSIHAEGRRARAAVDGARERLADVLKVRPHEIIFTSGGTESCNLGVLGIALAHGHRGRHIVTVPTEHHAVLQAIEHLQHHAGYEVTLIPVDRGGRVDPDALAGALREDTVLVSVMHANNETGTIQPIGEIADICRERGVFFHSDAVQSFGKLPFDAGSADAFSLAAHKVYGPQGVGVLWLRSGIALTRTAHGGSHENSRRPGTENVAAIVGMAAAAERVESRRDREQPRLAGLRDALLQKIMEMAPKAMRNGAPEHCLSNTLNMSFPDVDGEALLMALDIEGVSVSSGSACMVGSMQPSHVLLAMGSDRKAASSAVRFSLGETTTAEDIDVAAAGLARALQRQSSQQ